MDTKQKDRTLNIREVLFVPPLLLAYAMSEIMLKCHKTNKNNGELLTRYILL